MSGRSVPEKRSTYSLAHLQTWQECDIACAALRMDSGGQGRRSGEGGPALACVILRSYIAPGACFAHAAVVVWPAQARGAMPGVVLRACTLALAAARVPHVRGSERRGLDARCVPAPRRRPRAGRTQMSLGRRAASQLCRRSIPDTAQRASSVAGRYPTSLHAPHSPPPPAAIPHAQTRPPRNPPPPRIRTQQETAPPVHSHACAKSRSRPPPSAPAPRHFPSPPLQPPTKPPKPPRCRPARIALQPFGRMRAGAREPSRMCPARFAAVRGRGAEFCWGERVAVWRA